jgi:hypothetical protein
MKFATISRTGRVALFLSILACTLTTVHADNNDITTWAETEVPDWATANAMQLSLSASGLQFAVIPLTPNLGLNDTTGRVIKVRWPCIASLDQLLILA